MQSDNPVLPMGYSPIPAGKIANVVTCLEMLAPPPGAAPSPHPTLTLDRWLEPDIAGYRALYRAVGTDWLWTGRLVMADATLAALLADPLNEVHVLRDAGRAVGLLELDFRVAGECEIGYFGIVPAAIGHGAGRFLMANAIALAWARPIKRFWVHTCNFDHPSAVGFYRRSGFTPYAMMVEVTDDPRRLGLLPRSAAPHVPLIGG